MGIIFIKTSRCLLGIAESVSMEITGHSRREMFDRYNSIDDEDKKEAVDHSVDQNKKGTQVS